MASISISLDLENSWMEMAPHFCTPSWLYSYKLIESFLYALCVHYIQKHNSPLYRTYIKAIWVCILFRGACNLDAHFPYKKGIFDHVHAWSMVRGQTRRFLSLYTIILKTICSLNILFKLSHRCVLLGDKLTRQ